MMTKSHGHFSNNDAQALPRWGHISMPLLNYDILIHSMHFIELKEDLLSLMRTSRTLYQAGIPHLLRLVRICIYDEPDDDPPINMESFSSFISTDPARRGSIVREVTLMPSRLEVTHEYSQSVRAFAEALAQLHNLTTLAVYWAENWLNHSSISDALESLKNIRALRLDSHLDESNGNKSIDLLGRMASPLRALSLGFSHVAEYRNLFDILSHFAPALIYLELDKVALTSESEGTVYPNLKFLALGRTHADTFCISPLLTCAPNLQEIYLREVADLRLNNIERIRNDNVRAQTRHKSWRNLDAVRGDLDAIYALGLNCRTRLLRIYDSLMSDEDVRRLSIILQDIRPSALGIALDLTRLEFLDLVSIIPPFVRESLTHLSLSIILEPDEGEAGVYSVLQYITILVKLLPIKFIMLSLTWPKFGDNQNQDTPPQLRYISENRWEYIQIIQPLAPALHTMILDIRILDDWTTDAWKIKRSEECIEIEGPIQNYGALLNDEGMGASDWWDFFST